MRAVFTLIIIAAFFQILSGQSNLVEIDGSIVLRNNTETNLQPGTIRWNGSDFQGWNGQIWVSLSGNTEVGIVEDIDGNTYETVRIGDQIWMTENLRTTRYNDSTAIIKSADDEAWALTSQGAWIHYENNSSLDQDYGKLYNWHAVSTSKLCPTNWRVPTKAHYEQLIESLGGPAVAGGKLKEMGTEYWSAPNNDASNEKGFAGRGGGARDFQGRYINFGQFGFYWTIDMVSSSEALAYSLTNTGSNFGALPIFQTSGLSVRCIKK